MHPRSYPSPPRLIAPGGPVSRALLIMQDADPDLARIRNLRRAIAERIEADIALLDALAGDPDLEPSLGSLAGTGASLLLTGFLVGGHGGEPWAAGASDDREQDAGDDREADEDIEAENEDGTDDAEACA